LTQVHVPIVIGRLEPVMTATTLRCSISLMAIRQVCGEHDPLATEISSGSHRLEIYRDESDSVQSFQMLAHPLGVSW
jgi:hypothetical protein